MRHVFRSKNVTAMMSLSVSKQDCRNVIINSEYAADFSNNKLSVFEMKIFFKTVQKARNRLHRKSTLHHAAAQATSTTPITEPTKKHHHNLVNALAGDHGSSDGRSRISSKERLRVLGCKTKPKQQCAGCEGLCKSWSFISAFRRNNICFQAE